MRRSQHSTLTCRYGVLVYNGSVHYWHISRVLQREGMRSHLLPSEQIVVNAVRKLPDKQEWLSSLLLQLALGQLEVCCSRYTLYQQAEDAVRSSRHMHVPSCTRNVDA